MIRKVVFPLKRQSMDLTILEYAVRDYINKLDGGKVPPDMTGWSITKQEYYDRAISLREEITAYIKSPKITIDIDENL